MAREFEVTDRTSTSIKVRVIGLDTSYTKKDRYLGIYVDGTRVTQKKLSGGISQTPIYTISGLSPNTVYWLEGIISYTNKDGETEYAEVEPHETKTLRVQIAKWTWSKQNSFNNYSAEANSTKVKTAKQALDYHGSIGDFSYKVWNDLCWKVQEIVDALDESWNSYHARMTSSNTYLTAARYNHLLDGLSYCGGVSIDNVSQGDQIMSWHFLDLANNINEIIDEVNAMD